MKRKDGFTPLEKNIRERNSLTGFTFVEMVLALTIFSIIAVSIYSVLGSGIRVWRKSTTAMENTQSARIFFDTITKDLRNAVNYPQVGLKGEPGSLVFMSLIDVSTSVMSIPGTELAKIIYSFDPDKKAIIRYVATQKDGFSETAVEGDVLIECLDKAAFSYCFKDESKAPPYDWRDNWQEPDKIPRGIKITAGQMEKIIFIPTGELPEGAK